MDFAQQTRIVGYLLKTYPKLSETFILNEILQLEKFGVPLHLFSLRKPMFADKFHPAVYRVQANVTYIPSIGWRSNPIDSTLIVLDHLELCLRNPLRYFSTLWFYLRVPEEKRLKEFAQAGFLTRALQRRKIQHLHAHFANVPTSVAELVERFSGITFSFTAHAKDIYLSRKDELARKIRAAEFVVTCTGYNQRYLQDIDAGPTPIYLAYHGVDLSKFNNFDRASQLAQPLLILSVGRFCEKKGFFYLIEACRLLKARGRAFLCSIVGWGPLRNDLERMIVELDLCDCVSLVSEMTQDQLIHVYLTAGMFVLPCILTDNGDRDGIPNVLIEAMAMQVPVISTEVSGIPELVEHNESGILVPEKNSAALADAIELLLSGPDLRSRFGEKGRAKVLNQFTLEDNVRIVQRHVKGTEEGQSAAAKEKGKIMAHAGMR